MTDSDCSESENLNSETVLIPQNDGPSSAQPPLEDHPWTLQTAHIGPALPSEPAVAPLDKVPIGTGKAKGLRAAQDADKGDR